MKSAFATVRPACSVAATLITLVFSLASSAAELYDSMQSVTGGLGISSGQWGAQKITFPGEVASIDSVSLRLSRFATGNSLPVVICLDNGLGTAPSATCSSVFTTSAVTPIYPVFATISFTGSIGHINGLLRVDTLVDSVGWTC